MERKFYNSIQWGIQKEGLNNIRSKGLDYLDKIGCKTNLHYKLTIEDIIKNPKKIDEILSKKCTYLIILEPSDKNLDRILEFDVTQKKQIYTLLNRLNPEHLKQYVVSFIEQIQDNNKSFVGTAISDGKGELFIEILQGTTNSMHLTSTGANPENIDICYFSDFNTISILPKKLSVEYIQKIEKSCHFFEGYYEFVYGHSISNDDIYFTFYSDIKDYQNILNKMKNIDFKDEVRSRLIYNYLKSNQNSRDER